MTTEQSTLFAYDYETTGTDVTKDRPLQVGVCDWTGRIVINTLCNPAMPIAEEASKVHGISASDLVGFPDYLMALWTQEMVFLSVEDPIIAGFNTSMFDGPMFENCYSKPVYGEEILIKFRQLDLLDVIYRYYPTLEQKKLTYLHSHFLGRELEGAHGAIQDCIGTVEVLKWVCADLGKTPDELVVELKTPQAYEVMPIGKHRGVSVESVPKSWAQWMLSNADRMRPDLQATVELIANN
jgi:DNA polymerase III epsilon subunit-like protein